jgi:hypothetical protein
MKANQISSWSLVCHGRLDSVRALEFRDRNRSESVAWEDPDLHKQIKLARFHIRLGTWETATITQTNPNNPAETWICERAMSYTEDNQELKEWWAPTPDDPYYARSMWGEWEGSSENTEQAKRSRQSEAGNRAAGKAKQATGQLVLLPPGDFRALRRRDQKRLADVPEQGEGTMNALLWALGIVVLLLAISWSAACGPSLTAPSPVDCFGPEAEAVYDRTEGVRHGDPDYALAKQWAAKCPGWGRSGS